MTADTGSAPASQPHEKRHPRFRWMSYPFTGEHLPCNLCGSADKVVISTRDRWLRPLVNVVCQECGLVRLDPMPTEQETVDYYRHAYRVHYQGSVAPKPHVTERALRSARNRMKKLAPFLAEGHSIYDVGASSGEFVHVARRAGFDCEGVEPNIAFAKFAGDRYGVELRTGGWGEGEGPGRTFDVVTLHHVLEHLRTPRQALERFHGWLKPDGLLHIAVPDIADPRRTPLGRFHFAHLHGFSHETLTMLALRTGFEPHEDSPPLGTDLVFRRRAEPIADWMRYPEHARELTEFLQEHTIVRHLQTGEPWRRFMNRARRSLGRLFGGK